TGAAGGGWDSLPYAARYPALRDAGLLPRYYRALEDEVAARATTLRDRVLRQRGDLYFAFRLAQPPADWFTFGLLRGFGLPGRPPAGACRRIAWAACCGGSRARLALTLPEPVVFLPGGGRV